MDELGPQGTWRMVVLTGDGIPVATFAAGEPCSFCERADCDRPTIHAGHMAKQIDGRTLSMFESDPARSLARAERTAAETAALDATHYSRIVRQPLVGRILTGR